MQFNDAVFGAALVLAGIAIAVVASGFPGMPGQSFGPSLFPNVVAGGFGFCGLALIWGGLRRPSFPGMVQLGEWARSGGHILDVGLVIGGLTLVILLWDRVGFIPLATLFTAGLMARFRGGQVLTSCAGAFVAVLFIDWIFRRLLLVPLPLGPLTGIVW
jgi:putative tricarboxylic transport membrane protein